eukprot:4629491-Pyramimonas_sp.AAC.1
MFNDLFVRVYSAGAFDRFCSSHPQVARSSHADDDALTTEGSTEAEALEKMVQACASMFVAFRDELKVGLQGDKLTTFGSSLGIAEKLGRLLGQTAGIVTNST